MNSSPPETLDPRKIYPAVGRCIYCGADSTAGGLSDEHIIALSIGGTLLLPDASCAACAKATSKVEHHVGKAMWDFMRVQLGLPSRRPKDRPTHFDIEVDTPTGTETRKVPIPQVPAVVLSFSWFPPEILFGLPPSNEPFGGQINIHRVTPEANGRFAELARLGRLRLNPKGFGAIPFARMLAKIAHAYAVAELGAGAFRPFLRDIILEEEPRFIRHFIGSGTEREPASTRLHELSIARKHFAGRELVVVRVRLFARHELPVYYVVVGEAL